MDLKKCLECGVDIADNYVYCAKCAKEIKEDKKQAQKTESPQDTTELSKINNNLYFIRTALAVMLKQNYKIEIVWSKEKKAFIERRVK